MYYNVHIERYKEWHFLDNIDAVTSSAMKVSKLKFNGMLPLLIMLLGENIWKNK